MGKVWIWVIGVVAVVALGGGAFYLATRDSDGGTSGTVVQTGKDADAGATQTACDIFTPAIARQILGEGATKSEPVPGGDASTDDVSVTQCAYEAPGEGFDVRIASILVRGAKNTDAYSTNEFGFSDTRNYGRGGTDTAPSETISGLGDDAYYNAAFEQVNVLVNSGQYWVIVQVDGGQIPSEELARAVVDNL